MPVEPEPHVAPDIKNPSTVLTVLAVSRATPTRHVIHSHSTLTSIVRSPSQTSLVLSPEHGIEGHKPAIHDAQVYAFFAQHYEYWTSRLGIERSQWNWAFWGENLTLCLPNGVDETNIKLGDQWVFSPVSTVNEGQKEQNSLWQGHANSRTVSMAEDRGGVILEVCGGRNPCSRLAWRCRQPVTWLTEVARSGFCGVYLNIVRGGVISPGDTARIVPTRNVDSVPVSSIAQCAFSPLTELATRTLAERILRIPGLQHMNRQIISRKLEMVEQSEATEQGRWSGWRYLEVFKVVEESAFAKSFYLSAIDDKPLSGYAPGQFLTIKLPSGQIRCWSISSWSPTTITSPPPFYRITVKNGQDASRYLLSRVSSGDKLLARSPSGSFAPDWTKEFPPRQIYISAGIGITPTIAMLQAHLAHPTLSQTPAIFIHVTRNSDWITPGLLDELPSVPILRIIKFFTSPIPGVDIQNQNFAYAGRPKPEFFADLLEPEYQINPLGISPIDLPGNLCNAYICGSADFVVSIRRSLESSNVPSQAISVETFSYGSSIRFGEDEVVSIFPDGLDIPEESLVRFRSKEVKWKKSRELSLLQLIEEGGGHPSSGCRMGICGS
ncbi:hypothetical protein PG999_014448 [Apiospora kogelbergensis]|uniref:FAD-binding FR-type domain-containing protein n=1 Tax=Apiospora kogelbergensis TaxID=1337665 RepID=A0AAW0Q4W7_9PEZI